MKMMMKTAAVAAMAMVAQAEWGDPIPLRVLTNNTFTVDRTEGLAAVDGEDGDYAARLVPNLDGKGDAALCSNHGGEWTELVIPRNAKNTMIATTNDIGVLDAALAAKQNELTVNQMKAVNSGVTSNKVTAWEAHVDNLNNPHRVTAEQTGAYSTNQVDYMMAHVGKIVSENGDEIHADLTVLRYLPTAWSPASVRYTDTDEGWVTEYCLTNISWSVESAGWVVDRYLVQRSAHPPREEHLVYEDTVDMLGTDSTDPRAAALTFPTRISETHPVRPTASRTLTRPDTIALTSGIPPPPGDYEAVSNAAMTAHRDATNYTDVAMTAAIRSAENYTDGVLDSAAYLPRFYFKAGRWYRQDLVDRAADDIEMTLERYGDDVFVWFEAVDGPATVTLTNVKASATAPKLERLKDGAWSPFAFPVLLAEGERVIFRTQYGVTNSAYWKSDTENWKFGGNGRYAVGGDAMAFFVYEGRVPCPANALREVFQNNQCVVDVSRLVLPFTELGEACYQQMFYQASNLVHGVHVLPARHVPGSAYLSMFNTTAIDLSPRILAETVGGTFAMANMFINCNGLDHVYLPYLTNTANNSMRGFVQNAHNINRIATMVPVTAGATTVWTSGVADRGVLICPVSVGTQETITRGANACPTNWIVENIDAPFVQFTNAYGEPSTIRVECDSGTSPKLEYSTDGETWTAISPPPVGVGITIGDLNAYGDRLMVRALTGVTNAVMYGTRFKATGKVDVSGNIMSLISSEATDTITGTRYFRGLFSDSPGIANASGLSLPATNLSPFCYQKLFSVCANMLHGPMVLPARASVQGVYDTMFSDCREMTEGPAVMFDAVNASQPCSWMFVDCWHMRSLMLPNCTGGTQNVNALRGMAQNTGNVRFIYAPKLTTFYPCDDWCLISDTKPFYPWPTDGLLVCPAALGNRETIRRGQDYCPVGWDVINIR